MRRPARPLAGVTGTAGASLLALGLLVGGCVFTALAGPAFSLQLAGPRRCGADPARAGQPPVKTARMTAGW